MNRKNVKNRQLIEEAYSHGGTLWWTKDTCASAIKKMIPKTIGTGTLSRFAPGMNDFENFFVPNKWFKFLKVFNSEAFDKGHGSVSVENLGTSSPTVFFETVYKLKEDEAKKLILGDGSKDSKYGGIYYNPLFKDIFFSGIDINTTEDIEHDKTQSESINDQILNAYKHILMEDGGDDNDDVQHEGENNDDSGSKNKSSENKLNFNDISIKLKYEGSVEFIQDDKLKELKKRDFLNPNYIVSIGKTDSKLEMCLLFGNEETQYVSLAHQFVLYPKRSANMNPPPKPPTFKEQVKKIYSATKGKKDYVNVGATMKAAAKASIKGVSTLAVNTGKMFIPKNSLFSETIQERKVDLVKPNKDLSYIHNNKNEKKENKTNKFDINNDRIKAKLKQNIEKTLKEKLKLNNITYSVNDFNNSKLAIDIMTNKDETKIFRITIQAY